MVRDMEKWIKCKVGFEIFLAKVDQDFVGD
jgi:hypothetical protein